MTSPTKPRAREPETSPNSSNAGEHLAALWRNAFGSAWVGSQDLIGEGGPWEGRKQLQSAFRAMARAGIVPERQTVVGLKGWLYRLP